MPRRLPGFVIGGAPRSGTTWLATALDLHPDVWLAKPLRPEPKFFLVDETYQRGLDFYGDHWFADAPPGAVVGEKSTNYLESAEAAQRIARDLPEVKLIFVLREPVSRAISNYRWSVMNGKEDRDFETAIELEETRELSLSAELRYSRPHAYLSRSRYAELLSPYFDLFPREHILVLRSEDVVNAPGSTMADIHTFLSVSPRPDLAGQEKRVNPSTGAWEPKPETLVRLGKEFAPWNIRLKSLLGPDFPIWDEVGR